MLNTLLLLFWVCNKTYWRLHVIIIIIVTSEPSLYHHFQIWIRKHFTNFIIPSIIETITNNVPKIRGPSGCGFIQEFQPKNSFSLRLKTSAIIQSHLFILQQNNPICYGKFLYCSGEKHSSQINGKHAHSKRGIFQYDLVISGPILVNCKIC